MLLLLVVCRWNSADGEAERASLHLLPVASNRSGSAVSSAVHSLKMSERLIVAINSASASNPRGASLKSSILNLSNTILGTGLLALPAAFKHAGIVLGLFMVFSSSFLAGLSLFLLSEAAGLSGSKSTATFYSVCEAALPRLSLLVASVRFDSISY